MKTFLRGLMALVSTVALSLGLAACGEHSEEGNTSYRITCESGSYYTVTGLEREANAGDVIAFEVESSSVFYTVEQVTMNGEALTGGDFGYSFAMPEEDVEIEITMSPVGEYDDPDDHLSWGSNVTGEISLADGDTAQIQLSFDGISSGNWITSINDTVYSSDEHVIPTDAIEFVPRTDMDINGSSGSSAIITGYLSIDLTDVHEGETYLYVNLNPNNGSLGTLIKKFTVVAGEIEVPTMEVTFTYENKTDYPDENIFFNITDKATNDIQTIELNDFTDGNYTFEYAVGHTYQVTCAYATFNEEEGKYENMTNLLLNEWQGTNIGGATNRLDRDGSSNRYTLELTTVGIEVSFVIQE